MADAMMEINRLKNEVKNLQAQVKRQSSKNDVLIANDELVMNKYLWETNVIVPFSEAYTTAYISFKNTLANDEQLRQKRLEMLFNVMCLFGSGMLTLVLGKTTIKEKMGAAAMSAIAKNTMKRGFSTAKMIGAHPTGQFLLGQAWDTGKKWLSDKTKTLFMNANNNGPNKLLEQSAPAMPHKVAAALNQFHLDCSAAILASSIDIAKNKNIKDHSIQFFLKSMKNSAFFKPPIKRAFDVNLAEKIEFSFYLQMIMNSDNWVTTNQRGGVRRAQNINELPLDPDNLHKRNPKYPSRSNPGDYSRRARAVVDFGPLGESVAKRINQLYETLKLGNQALIPKDAWHEAFNHSGYGDRADPKILEFAQKKLTEYGDITVSAIQQAIGGRSK